MLANYLVKNVCYGLGLVCGSLQIMISARNGGNGESQAYSVDEHL